MSENSRGGETYHLPPTITSSAVASLDNFFMDFDPQSALGSEDVNALNETRAEVEDYTTGESSSTLHEYDNMPFSSQLGFEFSNRNTSQFRLVDGANALGQSRVKTEPNLVPSSMSVAAASAAPALNNTSVPEFLYQLTKMLTENNNDVIEWSHGMFDFSHICLIKPTQPLTFTLCKLFHFVTGRIEVHSPQKLESDVLKKYFRHSKFASFQRQLNYFGFRKLAGKGKMAPCSYVNDAAMDDISSLFQIKVSVSSFT